MSIPFHLTAVTPEKVFFDGDTTQVTVRTTEGDIGILANHISLLAGIAEGKLVIRTDEQVLTFELSQGFIKVGGNKATIIVDDARRSD